MTSRERVVATLRREPADRVPIDLGSHPSTGISAFAYWRLREHLGLGTDRIWIPDAVQFLAFVDADILERFHCDCVLLESRWPAMARWSPRPPYEFAVPAGMKPRRADDGTWVVTQGERRMRMPPGGFFFDGDWLCRYDDLDEDQTLALYAREAERIYGETSYATNFVGYSHGPGWPDGFFRGLEQATLMLTDPEAVRVDQERRCRDALRFVGKLLDRMGQWIQLITVGDDMGMQSGPLCNPALIEEFCIPYYKRLCGFIHANSDVKVFMHNCGAIRPLIPALIDAGIDVLNPVQISAVGMDPRALKDAFGDRIVFWGGGCDTQNVLGSRTPEEVGEHVRGLMRIFKRGGGFVFNQVHNILGNVPPENIVAMLDAAYAESSRLEDAASPQVRPPRPDGCPGAKTRGAQESGT